MATIFDLLFLWIGMAGLSSLLLLFMWCICVLSEWAVEVYEQARRKASDINIEEKARG